MVSEWLQYALTGISLGSVYALLALGLTFVYKVSGVINLAQGEFFILGGFLVYTGLALFNLPVFVVVPAAALVVVLVALVAEHLAIRPLSTSGDLLVLIIMTVAVMFILNGFIMMLWGKSGVITPYFLPGSPIRIAGAVISMQAILLLVLLCASVVGTQWFLKGTRWGKALRACSENPLAAQLMGIDVHRMIAASYALSGLVGALSGGFVAPLLMLNYNLGLLMMIKGFVGAILGGLDNPPGAFVGGLLVGLFETFSVGLISSDFKEISTLSLLLIILILRPQGILGRTTS